MGWRVGGRLAQFLEHWLLPPPLVISYDSLPFATTMLIAPPLMTGLPPATTYKGTPTVPTPPTWMIAFHPITTAATPLFKTSFQTHLHQTHTDDKTTQFSPFADPFLAHFFFFFW